MPKTFVGSRVRGLRGERGYSQAALAAKLGISPSYLNQIEHDARPLTVAVLLRHEATLLGVAVAIAAGTFVTAPAVRRPAGRLKAALIPIPAQRTGFSVSAPRAAWACLPVSRRRFGRSARPGEAGACGCRSGGLRSTRLPESGGPVRVAGIARGFFIIKRN